ncbi:ADP-ribosyltransferase, partial [Vibrio anguillarum]|uniref:ADP-ribosyltransferase n=1 Tax=Vibrio anguillarum TaxID=55601 RepID=UPI001BE40AED
AQKTVRHLAEAFSLTKQDLTLKIGQRLYRGVSITEAQLQEFFDAADTGTPLTHKNYMSTSLSESIAKAFSALSYLGKLRENPDDASTLAAVVIELTNRRNDLEFILPDALKLVNHNQGQMEVLLPRNIKILPTHFELDEFNAKIYADIV